MLTKAGIEHIAEHPGLDDAELAPTTRGVEAYVASLAFLKAAAGAVLPQSAGVDVVLGADTACEQNGTIIGTPTNEDEAYHMIRSLSGREHRVLSGVALVGTWDGRRVIFVDEARVSLGRLSEDEIRTYVASGEWRGKAGGYNLSERLAAGWPIEHSGDPTTIMGLPMRRLVPLLDAWNDHVSPLRRSSGESVS
ncbi:MAG: Maf family protein [Phycisphaerales bacterium]|nr:MAG: Maf family protein [Phycisphaerales bacterium]